MNFNRCSQVLFKPYGKMVTKATCFMLKMLYDEVQIIYMDLLGNVTHIQIFARSSRNGIASQDRSTPASPAHPSLAVTAAAGPVHGAAHTEPPARTPQTPPGTPDTACAGSQPSNRGLGDGLAHQAKLWTS